jgi:hypothetical protein
VAENAFPAPPVRPSNVLVWIAGSDTVDTLDDVAQQVSIARRRLADHATPNLHDEVLLDVLRLEPTARSCLNGTDVGDGKEEDGACGFPPDPRWPAIELLPNSPSGCSFLRATSISGIRACA